jgi:hypothetical protein
MIIRMVPVSFLCVHGKPYATFALALVNESSIASNLDLASSYYPLLATMWISSFSQKKTRPVCSLCLLFILDTWNYK